MIIILILLIAALASAIIGGALTYASRKKPKPEQIVLSWPARKIYNAYKNLPEDHRPEGDMLAALQALDIKYRRSEVNDHFGWYGAYSSPSWTAHCSRDKCNYYPEYMTLHNQIEDIKKAIRDREHMLEMAGIQPGLDEVELITARLRDESVLIKAVTKELA